MSSAPPAPALAPAPAPTPAALVYPKENDECAADNDPTCASKFEQLQRSIVARSDAAQWADACAEWRLYTVLRRPSGVCLCTQRDIVKRCIVRNVKNSRFAVVGSCCIERFDQRAVALKEQCSSVFDGLERVRADPWGARPTPELVELAVALGHVYDDAAAVVRGVGRARPSENQLAAIVRVNLRLITAFCDDAPACTCTPDHVKMALRLGRGQTLFYGCALFPKCKNTRPDPLKRTRKDTIKTWEKDGKPESAKKRGAEWRERKLAEEKRARQSSDDGGGGGGGI